MPSDLSRDRQLRELALSLAQLHHHPTALHRFLRIARQVRRDPIVLGRVNEMRGHTEVRNHIFAPVPGSPAARSFLERATRHQEGIAARTNPHPAKV